MLIGKTQKNMAQPELTSGDIIKFSENGLKTTEQ